MVMIKKYRDDFSGEEVYADDIHADYTVSFGGESFVLDATDATVKAIREALQPFRSKARNVTGEPVTADQGDEAGAGPDGEAGATSPEDDTQAGTAALVVDAPRNEGGTNGSNPASSPVREVSNEEIRRWARLQPKLRDRANARGTAFQDLRLAYVAAHS